MFLNEVLRELLVKWGGGEKVERSQGSKDVDEYILQFSPEVQVILQQIRNIISTAAPEAEEIISYRMPAFRFHGILVYFAAFKQHIGLYPPVSGDHSIEQDILPYAGEKGNLRFPLDRPIPFNLIRRIVKLRLKQNQAKAAAKQLNKKAKRRQTP